MQPSRAAEEREHSNPTSLTQEDFGAGHHFEQPRLDDAHLTAHRGSNSRLAEAHWASEVCSSPAVVLLAGAPHVGEEEMVPDASVFLE